MQDKIDEIMGLVREHGVEMSWDMDSKDTLIKIESKLRDLVREPLGYKGGLQSDDKVTLFFDNTECATTWFESFMDCVDSHNITDTSGDVKK